MLKRRGKGQDPQCVFTSDFHQLVRGDLLYGRCVIRYDPHRIVPHDEIPTLPATQQPILAAVRFHPAGTVWQGELRFPAGSGIVPDEDPTGQGTMLEIECGIPEGCDELECWFSYVDSTGQTRWDSAGGSNFWLRFPTHDLEIMKAEISGAPGGALDTFHLEVESLPAVASIAVRWRYANAINDARHQQALVEAEEGAKKRWTLPAASAGVAWDTPLAFDLVYSVNGHFYTEDNGGGWFVVARS